MVAPTVDSRAQEIVATARQRLADAGGKASMLPQMVQRVTQEFELQDQQRNMSDHDTTNFSMPNNMDAYLDQILGMAGMKQPAQAQGGGGGANVPLPPQRPTEDTGDVTQAADGVGFGGKAVPGEGSGVEPAKSDTLGTVLAAGGAAGLLEMYRRYAMNKKKNGGVGQVSPADDVAASPQSAIDQTIDEIDGKAPGREVALRPEPGVPANVADNTGSPFDAGRFGSGAIGHASAPPPAQVEGPPVPKQLTGPPKQLTGPDLIGKLSEMPVNDAFDFIDKNGLNAEEVLGGLDRTLSRGKGASSLADRVPQIAREAVQGAVRHGVRTGVR